MEKDDETTSELYFMIADFLTRYSPCQKAAKMLQEELETHKLLPHGVSIDGTMKNSTFDDMSRKFQTSPPDQLLNVFSKFKQIVKFNGSLMNMTLSSDQRRDEKTSNLYVENLFRLGQIESELKRLKILRSMNSERLLESGSRIQQENSMNTNTDLLEVNMKLRSGGFQSWISESGHVRVHRVCRVSSDIVVALTGSSSNTSLSTQKSNDLKPGMFVRVSQFDDHNDDEFGVVAYVVRANSSNGQVRLRVTSTSWRHMESKIRRGMISRSERIDDLETRRLALKSKQTQISVRSRLSTKSNLSSYLFQRKFSWRQRPNTTTSLYKKLTHMRTLSGHQSYPIFCIAFDHSGNNVITGADDYLVKVWSSRTCINRTISLFLGYAIDRHVRSNTTYASPRLSSFPPRL